MSVARMLTLDPARTAVVAIDMHRGHLDPAVATLPLPAERCGPVIRRAAELFDGVRARGVPVVHVVTEYRGPAEIAANPFGKAIHDDPSKARKGILHHNLAGSPGTEIIPELHDPRDLVVRGKRRHNPLQATAPEFTPPPPPGRRGRPGPATPPAPPAPRALVVPSNRRYNPFQATDLEFTLRLRLG